MIEQEYASATSRSFCGAKQASGAGTDQDDVKLHGLETSVKPLLCRFAAASALS
jgi:hypothetical protein